MIKVTVLYPNGPGNRFDLAYYLVKHIPMVQQKLGAALKGTAVEGGVSGTQPGSPPHSSQWAIFCSTRWSRFSRHLVRTQRRS
jgi:uncharacterized protein (TIGR02118 family)